MRIRLWVLLLFLIPILDCGIQQARCESLKSGMSRDEAIKLFSDANEKYQQAMKLIASKDVQAAHQKLKETVLQYETILEGGFKNGQVYYNLGNAYYRLGETGKAIVNYRRAEWFMPGNADLNANLKLVKGTTEDKELSTEVPMAIRRILFWYFLLNQNELSVVAVFLYVLLMVFIFLSIIRKYAWFKRVIIVFSVVLFIVVISLGCKIYAEQGVCRGVIIAAKCAVRYGPGEEYEPKFEIHNGMECVIEGEKDDWYRVYVKVGVKQDKGSKTSPGENVSSDVRKGWVQKKDIDVI